MDYRDSRIIAVCDINDALGHVDTGTDETPYWRASVRGSRNDGESGSGVHIVDLYWSTQPRPPVNLSPPHRTAPVRSFVDAPRERPGAKMCTEFYIDPFGLTFPVVIFRDHRWS